MKHVYILCVKEWRFLSERPLDQKWVQCCLEAFTPANLPHCGLVLSYRYATLLYVLSDLSLFQGIEIIYVFILLFYIFMLLLCVSQPWLPIQVWCSWAFQSYMRFLNAPCQLNDSVARNMKTTKRSKSQTLKVLSELYLCQLSCSPYQYWDLLTQVWHSIK